MSFPQNEVAADNARRRLEEAPKSPVGGVIENAVSLSGPGLAVASAVVATGALAGTGLAVAGSVVAGLGIVDWFRKLGTAKVNENLETLGQATEDALNRVERVLLEHGTGIDEIRNRLNSQGFKDGMASASLQALRTTQEDRLKRLAQILANGVRESDLVPGSLDDMMRAAVELREDDIWVLDKLCKEQADILATTGKTHGDLWPDDVRRNWQQHLFDHKIPGRSGQHYLDWRSSLSRLSALGFLIPVQPVETVNSPGHDPHGVSLQGVEFLARLKETE